MSDGLCDGEGTRTHWLVKLAVAAADNGKKMCEIVFPHSVIEIFSRVKENCFFVI